jgi:hypothetical protein
MIAGVGKRVGQRLWPDDGDETPVYAILDAARDEKIYGSILSSRLEWSCLYSGSIPTELARVAPYLVKLRREHSFTESMIQSGWGDNWGIFLRSDSGLSELRKHFHSFLTVEDEDGKRLVFRYYDPRVFRVYLPTCHLDELLTVFGPVKSFLMEARDPSTLLEFQVGPDGLVAAEHSLLYSFPAEPALGENLTP